MLTSQAPQHCTTAIIPMLQYIRPSTPARQKINDCTTALSVRPLTTRPYTYPFLYPWSFLHLKALNVKKSTPNILINSIKVIQRSVGYRRPGRTAILLFRHQRSRDALMPLTTHILAVYRPLLLLSPVFSPSSPYFCHPFLIAARGGPRPLPTPVIKNELYYIVISALSANAL